MALTSSEGCEWSNERIVLTRPTVGAASGSASKRRAETHVRIQADISEMITINTTTNTTTTTTTNNNNNNNT